MLLYEKCRKMVIFGMEKKHLTSKLNIIIRGEKNEKENMYYTSNFNNSNIYWNIDV